MFCIGREHLIATSDYYRSASNENGPFTYIAWATGSLKNKRRKFAWASQLDLFEAPTKSNGPYP